MNSLVKNAAGMSKVTARQISTTVAKGTTQPTAATFMGPFALGPPKPKVMPTALDHLFLRWSGHFRKGQSIPNMLESDIVHRARSHAAIRVNLGLMAAATLLSFVMVIDGKEQASRGDSLQKQNIDWHQHLKKQHDTAMEALSPY